MADSNCFYILLHFTLTSCLLITLALRHSVTLVFHPFAPGKILFIDSRQHQPFNLPKIILLWTTWFFDEKWSEFFRDLDPTLPVISVRLSNGQSRQCVLSTERSLADNASVLIFSEADFGNTRDVPKQRYSWQRWAYLMEESPDNARHFVGFTERQIHGANQIKFNWTISYNSKTADIVWPYVKVTPKSVTDNLSAIVNDKIERFVTGFHRRTYDACWTVTHDPTAGRRETLAKALVDQGLSLFKCGRRSDHPCPDGDMHEFFAQSCRFVFAFENSLCEDYISEKFHDALRLTETTGVIPVVYGGGNYSQLLPAEYYIKAMDYDTAAHLVEKLKSFRSNSTEILNELRSMYSWMFRYEVSRQGAFLWPLETICKRIWSADQEGDRSVIGDLRRRLDECQHEPMKSVSILRNLGQSQFDYSIFTGYV